MGNYFVVGGSSGIGAQIVKDLEEEGHNIYTTYNSNSQTSRNNVRYHALDVTKGDIELEDFPDRLDGVVYCPGSINLKPFNRFKIQDFADDFALQVLGAIKIINYSLASLRNSDNPSIVLFSTVAVQKGFDFHSQVSTSKGAIEGLVRSLASEFSPTIRVNAIAPGLTDTPLASRLLSTDKKRASLDDMNPMKRVGRVKDISGLALFLLSEKASWITGQVIHADGGMSAIN